MLRPHEQKNDRALQVLLGSAYGVAILAPLAVQYLTGRPFKSGQTLEIIGNVLILMAFPILALQPVLAGRFRVLDRAFGLDGVYVFHKTMGLIAASLLLCATASLASAGSPSIHWTWVVTTVLVLLLAATALLQRQLHLPYETWRLIHNVLAVTVLIRVLIHAVVLEARSGSTPAVLVSIAFFLFGAACYVNHRLLGPRSRSRKAWSVESVRPETHNVWTLTLRPPEDVEPPAYLPGQFQFLTFDGGKGEEHPFTISSDPSLAGARASTIKGSGDFTRTIGTTVRPGDRVAVQGPFGRFSYALHPDEKDLVFIAGGIGITPIMSMLRHMKGTKADIDAVLLYGNVAEKDIVFRKELDEIAAGAHPRLSVVHVLNRAEADWKGERGAVTEALIRKYCTGDLAKKTFYLCGPPPMMAALIGTLYAMGVPAGNIRFERFAL